MLSVNTKPCGARAQVATPYDEREYRRSTGLPLHALLRPRETDLVCTLLDGHAGLHWDQGQLIGWTMLRRPIPGQLVRVHYSEIMADQLRRHECSMRQLKKEKRFVNCQDQRGEVVVTGCGPGPITVAVRIDERIVVVPQENLVRERL